MRVRARVIPLWGWNKNTALRISAPVLIIVGEFDTGGGGIQDFAGLYSLIPHELLLKVQSRGTFIVWEPAQGATPHFQGVAEGRSRRLHHGSLLSRHGGGHLSSAVDSHRRARLVSIWCRFLESPRQT